LSRSFTFVSTKANLTSFLNRSTKSVRRLRCFATLATIRPPQPPRPTNRIGEMALGFVSISSTTNLRCLSIEFPPNKNRSASAPSTDSPTRGQPLSTLPLLGMAQKPAALESFELRLLGLPARPARRLARSLELQVAEPSAVIGYTDEGNLGLRDREQTSSIGFRIASQPRGEISLGYQKDRGVVPLRLKEELETLA